MGESYRGITIEIKGETTKLTKALRSADSAIKQTQSELRRINQALKFDSTSTMLVNAKIDEMGQRSQQTRARLLHLKDMLGKLGNDKNVLKLVNETDNLALATENARARYARVDEQLARIYNSLKPIAAKNEVAFNSKDPFAMVEALKELGLVTDQQYEKILKLKNAHEQANKSLEVHKQALQYKDLTYEIERTEQQLKSYAQAQAALKSSSWDKQRSEIKALNNELDDLSGISKVLKNEFKTLEEAMKFDTDGASNAGEAYKNLGDQVEIAQAKANALKKAIEKLEASGVERSSKSTRELAEAAQKAQKEYEKATSAVTDLAGELQLARERAIELESASGKGSNEYKEQQAHVKALENELKKLVEVQEQASTALNTARGEQELRDLETQAKATAAEVGKLSAEQSNLTAKSNVSNSALKSVGMTAYATVSPAFTQMGYASIDSADQIDSAFRNMKKTVNGTEEDFDNLREAAIEFSRTNAVSADTILNIEAMGGQLGIAVENLEAFGTVVSNLDIATNMDADTIAEKLGQLNGIMPDINDNYEAFGDALVRLGNNMPAQESAIMDITSRIGSMGSIVGMSTPEILAWASAIAATGQGAESAGTAISNTMSDIEGAVASGGDKLQAFADVAGVSAEEFAESWNTNPSEAMLTFVEGLKRIDEEGGSVDGTLQSLGITGVRQKQALQGLTQTCDTLNDALTMSNDAWNGVADEWGEAGDAAREASQKSEGFSGTLQILRNSVDELGYEFGQALIPFMQAATSAIQVFTDVFSGLPQEMKNLVVVLGLLGVVSGPLITGYASLSNVMSEIKKKSAATAAAQKAMAASMSATGTAAATSTTTFGKLTEKVKALGIRSKATAVALNALKAASAIGVAVGLQLAIEGAVNAYTRFKNLEKATTGLDDALNSINSTSAQNGLEALSGSAASTATSIDELIEKQAQLVDSIAERGQEVAANQGMLDGYKSTIDELAGSADLSADDVARLQTAVEGVNSICGSQYEVVQNAAGAWVLMQDGVEQTTEALDKYIEASKRQMEIQALQSSSQEIYTQMTEAQQTLNEAKEEAAKIEQEYNDSLGAQGGVLEEVTRKREEANKKVEEAQALVDGLSSSYDKSTQAQELLAAAGLEGASANMVFAGSCNSLQGALMGASGNSVDFINACDSMGISLESLASTNEGAMTELAYAWDGNVATLLGKANQLGDQLPQETRDAILKSAASMINASPEMVNAAASACNMTNDEFIKFAQEAGLTGEDAINAFVDQMNAGVPDAETAAENVKNGAAAKLEDFKEDAADSGDISLFAQAIATGSSKAAQSAQKVADNAGIPLKSIRDSSYTWGSHLASNFASGIRAGGSLIGGAASFVAQVAASYLRHSIAKKGVFHEGGKGEALWGAHLVENFAKGMVSASSLITSASNTVADNAKDALESVDPDATIQVKAIITEMALANGARLLLSSEAAEMASRARYASALASAVAATNTISNTTTNNNSQTIVYQIGDVHVPENSAGAKALEDFVDWVIENKGAM